MANGKSGWRGDALLECFEAYPGMALDGAGVLTVTTTRENPRLACPEGALHPTGKYLIIEMSAEGGESAELFLNGVWWERTGRRIMLISDGAFHRYNLDLGGVDPDDMEIYAASFLPTDLPGARVRIRSLHFSDVPEGEPAIRIRWAGLGAAFNRIGQGPREFVVSLENQGGGGSDSLEIAELRLPPGVRVAESGEAWRKLPRIGANDCGNGRFRLEAGAPVRGEFSIRLSGKNAPKGCFCGTLEFLPALNLPAAEYVPEPVPVETGEFELGALYFPGWTTTGRWDTIRETAPERRPLLGYYREGDPELVDWQIKWAVESGLRFLLVDWYWSAGNYQLHEWLDGFRQARYRSMIRWAVMWANHNPPGTHSVGDQIAVTRFWIDNCFNMPEYYRIDGKPVVMVWMWENMDRDLGEGGAKKLLALSREMAVEAGYPGIHFIDMKWPEAGTSPEIIAKIRDIGFDSTSIYHYMESGGRSVNPYYYHFDDVAATNSRHWEALRETGLLPFLPNLSTGWDDRPWHGSAGCAIPGRTVEAFGRICADARAFGERTGIRRMLVAPLNEWGEGSYIEPNTEFGFGMYECLRRTFGEEPAGGWPQWCGPEDVGLGAREFRNPEETRRTRWSFGDGSGGWVCRDAEMAVRDGALCVRLKGARASISVPRDLCRISEYSFLRVKLVASGSGSVRLRWMSTYSCNWRNGSAPSALPAGPEVGEYRISAAEDPDAPEIAAELGLFFRGAPGTEFRISEMELV
ncbi:MAG: hypothetical protein HPZ91_17450 [Lentisphaeria bacterium]|nr:hypothetical protein [Lentisphaeria bacterium]